MRRLRMSFRKVLPPRFITAAALFTFACLFALEWLIGAEGRSMTHELRDAWFVSVAACFGMWRAYGLPRLKTPYGAWLKNSPWVPGQPLPMGPIRLVWQDVVIVGALAACVYDSPQAVTNVLQSFLLAYVAVLGIGFFLTKTRWCGYLIAFGLGLWAVQDGGWGKGLVIAGLVLTSRLGLFFALRSFPWKDDVVGPPIDLAGIYPFHQLRFDDVDTPLHWFEGLTLSVLAGWGAYVCGQDPQFKVVGFAFFLLFLIALIRLVRYVNMTAAPISILGRLRTLRLVIPAYDQVFVAPLAIMVAGPSVMAIAETAGASSALIAALGVGVMVLIALNMGPNLRSWRLTGGQRIHVGEQIVAGRKPSS
jgi:hypothetical protein